MAEIIKLDTTAVPKKSILPGTWDRIPLRKPKSPVTARPARAEVPESTELAADSSIGRSSPGARSVMA